MAAMPDGWKMLAEDGAQLTDFGAMTLTATRMIAAAVLGGIIGYERETAGKPAGMRTHMLVALGSAFFVLAPQLEGIDLSRVIQGIVTGIGFLGGGAILKLSDEHRVKGLTTAASIWLAAAIGIAVGIGRIGAALMCTLLTLVILRVLLRVEDSLQNKHQYKQHQQHPPSSGDEG